MAKKTEKVGLIIPPYIKSFPSSEEINCGLILSSYFESKIECIPSDNANAKSPDFLVKRTHQRWEVKAIRGNTDNNLHHAFERSYGQSENLIVYLGRTKMRPKSAIGRIKRELKYGNSKKRVLLVTKDGHVVAIK